MLQKYFQILFTTSELLSPGCGRACTEVQSRYYAKIVNGVTVSGCYASVNPKKS
jgi:hypothetical protein